MSGNQAQQPRPVAIVTGVSAGIGKATAPALAAAGYRVFGTYRRPPATRSPGIEYLACDVTSDESVKAAVGEVLAKTGRIDLLVNNAGWDCSRGRGSHRWSRRSPSSTSTCSA
jgi:NAD(P)-dependent dehydrogenase (short-subunit alcohol dehydrogenase family)